MSMSHDPTIHAAQTAILRELLFTPEAGFAQLQKPTGLSSNHFNFHIARLVELKLVSQAAGGHYRLTTRGKEYANRLDTDERMIERQGKVAVLVVPRRERPDGEVEYMVQKRLKQPFYGRHGFMTGKLRWGETVLIGAARELAEETGLVADIVVKALYHKLDYAKSGDLLEDKHFYMVLATNVRGEFTAAFEGGENYWYTLAEIMALENVFAGMDMVAATVEHPGVGFLEKAYEYDESEY
jgi:ADP-ribose pyrophosphatase YjhB (NUDIX family)